MMILLYENFLIKKKKSLPNLKITYDELKMWRIQDGGVPVDVD